MTTEHHREPTIPGGLGFWYFGAEGFFYVGTRFGPTAISQFLDGPGCDPTGITDADAGIVNDYMDAEGGGANITARTFAEVRDTAWRRWGEMAHEYGPGRLYTPPWWADGASASYATERAAAREETPQ